MIAKISAIAGFCLLLLFPGIQWLTHRLPDVPLMENRRAAPAPEWGKTPFNDYFVGWQTWFNDRYAGRNFLIRLKTQIDYSLFHYSDRIHIGKDGWLFYRSVIDVQEPAVESMTDRHHDEVLATLHELQARLERRGITLLIVDNEMKDVFYPDKLPLALPRRTNPTRYSQLRAKIAKAFGDNFIDSTAILSQVARERPVFHRTDFHWNDPAAFAVAKAVVDRAAAIAGPGYRGWRWPLETTEETTSGGEAAFMPLLRPVTESSLMVKKTWPDLPRDYRPSDGPFEYTVVHKVDDPSLLPGIVVRGDSYFDGMVRAGFVEHFRAVHRARGKTLDEVVAAIPEGTRFFLLQFISPSVPALTIPLAPEAPRPPNGS